MKGLDKLKWLPTTRKEMMARGWTEVDVVLFTGDAYVDHPSFGTAVIGRTLENLGLRVGIVPQPDWRGDHRDFTKLGRPRLFFGVSAGAMDSTVNHYTANGRLRSDDAYTAGRRAGMRPDYPTIIYTRILKQLFPDTPVVLGGIEASLRRFTHYDYIAGRLRPGILIESGADLLVYGMGEEAVSELARRLMAGCRMADVRDVPQTAYLHVGIFDGKEDAVGLFAHNECVASREKQARNFRLVEEESNRYEARTVYQPAEGVTIVANPPYPPMNEARADAAYDLPYTRLPHPKYAGAEIPAFVMIQHSVNIHRGCFGGCAFCTISAHQGKFIASRSRRSVLREVEAVVASPGFKGYISDLGGPSANMYGMGGMNEDICRRCVRPSCIYPKICRNLDANHDRIIELYRAVDSVPGVRKSFVGSGVRYDMLLGGYAGANFNRSARRYAEELIVNHVSGRLKVAPEHTEPEPLRLMRKPPFEHFECFANIFREINSRHRLNQQLVPYFISSHPGCSEADMARLAARTRALDFRLEQVQDFTPSPMTLATEMFYTGLDPHSLKPVYSARSREERESQRQYFFWYDKANKLSICRSLRRLGLGKLERELFGR
ncbi:MAG: YgiQ family radical SAM protein [Tannerellaceae bacterium]|nr:YgiQ family radical SAM protein [Tannerellaceae bacterium]